MLHGLDIDGKLIDLRIGMESENFDRRCPQVTDTCTCLVVVLHRLQSEQRENLIARGKYYG
jgi:hypothetical protein